MATVSSMMRGAGLALRSSLAPSRSLSCLARLPPSSLATTQLTCRVPNRTMASKGDLEVAAFLKDEIATEAQNSRGLPRLQGWEVKPDGAEVTLTKTTGGEKVMITLNVNHTVDSAQPDDGSEEAPEMLSKPTFEVDLIKAGGKTLSFTCSFVGEEEHPEGQEGEGDDDVFCIDEVTMFEGDNHSDSCYAVAGDILDGYLYDLFMNLLAERGVDSAFAEELSAWCSAHEHAQYIGLLQQVEKWAKL